MRDEHSRVTYEIEKRGQICKLIIVHELEHAPKTAEHVANGWGLVCRPMPMPEPI